MAEEVMKFRVLAGWACDDDGVTQHGPGSVFESKHPLDDMFNTASSKKFERVGDSRPVAVAEPIRDRFDNMTVNELRTFATEEEIDLGGAKTKQELITKIRSTPGFKE